MVTEIHYGKRLMQLIKSKGVKPEQYARFRGNKSRQAFYDLGKRSDIGLDEIISICTQLLGITIDEGLNFLLNGTINKEDCKNVSLEKIHKVLLEIAENTK